MTQVFKIYIITEAGCRRGTNTYQCWLPLQLEFDVIQVHNCTESIKTQKNIASKQADKSWNRQVGLELALE